MHTIVKESEDCFPPGKIRLPHSSNKDMFRASRCLGMTELQLRQLEMKLIKLRSFRRCGCTVSSKAKRPNVFAFATPFVSRHLKLPRLNACRTTDRRNVISVISAKVYGYGWAISNVFFDNRSACDVFSQLEKEHG